MIFPDRSNHYNPDRKTQKMKLYSILRRWLSRRDATILVSLWYAVLLYLVFVGMSQFGIDLRYANM